MNHGVKAEVTLTGESARLFEIFYETAHGSALPGAVNRAVYETGLVHHTLMLLALGVVPEGRRDEVYALIEAIGKNTIMKDGFDQARDYWRRVAGMETALPGESDG
jgi:hypothetical protein